MYHRIATPKTDPWQLAVTPSHFAEHLEVIRRQGRSMLVRDLTRALADGHAPRRAIVVTFDDGYADNLHHALPLLERHDVPATMFIAAGCVGRLDGFWWDQLERQMLTPVDLPSTLRLEVRGQRHEYRLDATTRYTRDDQEKTAGWRAWAAAPTARHELFLTLYRLLRPLSDPERRRTLADLTAWSGGASPADSTAGALSVSELQTLASRTLVEIGAHTLTHPQLSALNDGDQRAEIHQSRVVLEETTGAKVVSFAYPYGGRSDYTADTVRLVRDAGFSGACASFPGVVRRATALFEVPRFQVEDCDGDGLARRLAAWMAAEARAPSPRPPGRARPR
jgi:peptidoglycan/xylan/chitin deacetylase (PgdA/CDA1 family)